MSDDAGPALTPKGRATRERLLAAAAEELRRHGSAEVAAVAARAGVAQSVLYRYFAGKDGLVAAVVDAFYDQYAAEVFDRSLEGDAALPPDAGWPEREALRLAREVGFLYAHPLGRPIATGLLHDAAATRADAARLREHVTAAARNIRHGQRAGELDPAVDAGLAAAAIIGGLRTMLAEALAREPPPPPAEIVDAALRVGRALLDPEGRRPWPTAAP
ncbi:TetR family transcriptional regulator [Patulibacter defluvii]|uniref:TetR family transcriptional regulator n=1 Tax=Patulibacter defluvii TaxID=3095358 RepID=UPI002A75E3D0|nr:TetR family transcriptional regulator [Patulibacter sp. DM4]